MNESEIKTKLIAQEEKFSNILRWQIKRLIKPWLQWSVIVGILFNCGWLACGLWTSDMAMYWIYATLVGIPLLVGKFCLGILAYRLLVWFFSS